jgi:uncharacterized DUF497 family protein
MQGKPFRWSEAKNERLKAERRVTFEDMLGAIERGGLLGVLEHANRTRYPHQRIMVVAFQGYAYLVPFVETAEHYFLKTIIPSRKATREHLHRGN